MDDKKEAVATTDNLPAVADTAPQALLLAAIDKGYPQIEIGNAAHEFQKQLDNQEKTMVGVNKYATEKTPIPYLKIDEELAAKQIARLQEVKRTRDGRRVIQTLNDLRLACQSGKNVMPYVIEAVREYTTEQEICDVYRDVFGEYRDPGYF